MFYRILADLIMVIHLAWIIFMLWGFVLTIRGFFYPKFFERWLFRTIHLLGIIFVVTLEILGKYCPLTLWENALRGHYNPETDYPGSFIIKHISQMIYPDVSPLVVIIPTILVAAFTLTMFIFKPPSKLSGIFK
ncbi:MAG: DUF2784 domain-containing protein [Calditrichia bacterium]